jgi:hypothetical protein
MNNHFTVSSVDDLYSHTILYMSYCFVVLQRTTWLPTALSQITLKNYYTDIIVHVSNDIQTRLFTIKVSAQQIMETI